MNNKGLFEYAVRNKLRYHFNGMISVEDLWDLNVENLDMIFKELNSQVKKVQEESLLGSKTKQDQELETKIEIIKYIVSTKLEENELRLKAREIKEQKQKILELISNKQNEELGNKSVEELQAMLNKLEG